jgi:transcriptional regulator with XRE-family HTH domain
MGVADWFGARLRELREQAGFTQQALGERAGLTRDGVAQLESGRRKPSWETAYSLASALGVSCDAFTQEPAALPGPKRGRPRKGPVGAKPERKQKRRQPDG